ncbi:MULTISPECIES: hypothetical protein [Cobetia]|uniref:hypothetical protein n=1 Tax=Cobetia TaxID=204286 RepID=UPI001583EAB7|nr:MULTISPECIES: hypothetical protein [Cobetia]MDI4659887.1 Dol-P-Glc:Glc(2)Man(9)GlcNAc(2)-PP-Dol alpha-1,2-glucosyltransferase [Cobetia sp. BMC6]NUJ55294.1 hypothetical protein [Cobetia marina]
MSSLDQRLGCVRARHRWPLKVGLVLLVLGACLSASLWLVSLFLPIPFVDEGVHFAQVRQFLAGDWGQHPKLTTLTLYHATMAVTLMTLQTLGEWLNLPLAADAMAGRWPEMPSVDWVRGLSLLGFSAMACMVWRALPSVYRRLDPMLDESGARQQANRQSWQWLWLPIIFPYLALVYTDPWIIALVALQLVALVHERRLALLALILVGLGLRQDSIVLLGLWGGLLLFMAHAQSGAHSQAVGMAPPLRSPLRQLSVWWGLIVRWWWVAVIPVAAFIGFVLWNDGIAMGDTGRHQAGWHTGNLGYYLGVIGVVFLPLWLADLPRQWHLLWRLCTQGAWPWRGILLLMALAGVWVMLVMSFEVTHDYNFQRWTIRNTWLLWLNDHPVGLWVTMLLTTSMALWWLRAPLRLGHGGLLLVMLALMVCTRELIETRYMLPLVTIFQLLRCAERAEVERAMTLWAVSMGALLMAGLVLTRTLP